MYFLKDKTWEEVRGGIFRKVYSLDKLKLDGVLPMIGLRMDCCLGNSAEVVTAVWPRLTRLTGPAAGY